MSLNKKITGDFSPVISKNDINHRIKVVCSANRMISVPDSTGNYFPEFSNPPLPELQQWDFRAYFLCPDLLISVPFF